MDRRKALKKRSVLTRNSAPTTIEFYLKSHPKNETKFLFFFFGEDILAEFADIIIPN
jgi:hypothetical protein